MDIEKGWVACISQSGTELVNICNARNHAPEIILTTNYDDIRDEVFMLGSTLLTTKGRPSIDQFFAAFQHSTRVTLHGFLYIIPGEICDQFTIYNGHPALITKYPELKGKDKQKDAFMYKDKYPEIGSVLHEVVAELDAGRILITCRRENTCQSEEDAFALLKETSLHTWFEFFGVNYSVPGLILERQ